MHEPWRAQSCACKRSQRDLMEGRVTAGWCHWGQGCSKERQGLCSPVPSSKGKAFNWPRVSRGLLCRLPAVRLDLGCPNWGTSESARDWYLHQDRGHRPGLSQANHTVTLLAVIPSLLPMSQPIKIKKQALSSFVNHIVSLAFSAAAPCSVIQP